MEEARFWYELNDVMILRKLRRWSHMYSLWFKFYLLFTSWEYGWVGWNREDTLHFGHIELELLRTQNGYLNQVWLQRLPHKSSRVFNTHFPAHNYNCNSNWEAIIIVSPILGKTRDSCLPNMLMTLDWMGASSCGRGLHLEVTHFFHYTKNTGTNSLNFFTKLNCVLLYLFKPPTVVNVEHKT